MIDQTLLDTGELSARAAVVARYTSGDSQDLTAEAQRIAGMVNAAAAEGRITAGMRLNWAKRLARNPGTEGVFATLAASDIIADANRRSSRAVAAAAGVPTGRTSTAARAPRTPPRAPRHPAYDRNPLVTAARNDNPALAARARTVAPVPTLFAGGDLPPFTASGIPPEALLQVPWQARHAVAAATTAAEAYKLLDEYGGEGGEVMAEVDLEGHPANADYRRRVNGWLGHAMTDDEVFASTFGEVQQRDEQKRAATNDWYRRTTPPKNLYPRQRP